MSPVHVAPGASVRIVLVVEVIYPVLVEHPVRVVHPSVGRGMVDCRSPFLSVGRVEFVRQGNVFPADGRCRHALDIDSDAFPSKCGKVERHIIVHLFPCQPVNIRLAGNIFIVFYNVDFPFRSIVLHREQKIFPGTWDVNDVLLIGNMLHHQPWLRVRESREKEACHAETCRLQDIREMLSHNQ